MPRKSKKRLRYEKAGERLMKYNEERRRLSLQTAAWTEKNEESRKRRRLSYYVDKHLKPVEGQVVSEGEVQQWLRLYFHLVLKKTMDPDGALSYVSEALGVSKPAVESARDEFMQKMPCE